MNATGIVASYSRITGLRCRRRIHTILSYCRRRRSSVILIKVKISILLRKYADRLQACYWRTRVGVEDRKWQSRASLPQERGSGMRDDHR